MTENINKQESSESSKDAYIAIILSAMGDHVTLPIKLEELNPSQRKNYYELLNVDEKDIEFIATKVPVFTEIQSEIVTE